MWIILAIVVAIALWLIWTYNGLIRLRNQMQEAWSDIDVQLKRRHDLIPNLINTVKGYAAHESNVLTQVTQARASAMSAGNAQEKLAAENMLSQTLKSLFAVVENYPDLKANQNFLRLQDELSDTENKIQAARRFYNGNVRDFNSQLQSFPTNVIGSTLHFRAREFFELAGDAEREVPIVQFS